MYLYRRLLITGLALILVSHVMAGGWPKKKGTGYYKIGYSWIHGSHFFNATGGRVELERMLNFSTVSFYGEYGLTDRLTAIAYLPVATTAKLEAQQNQPSTSITTIGDTNIGFRYGLITDKPTVLSASLTLGLPFGQTASSTSASAEDALQTGDGEFNQLVKLESGHSLGGGFYASSFAGVNFRSKGFSEEVRIGGEVGHVSEKIIAIVKIKMIKSFKNGDDTGAATLDFFNNNMEFTSIAPEVAYNLTDNIGLSVNYTVYLEGVKTLANPNTTVGIFFDM